MVQRTVAGHTCEYLVLEYAPSKRGHPGDRLYVPMDQLDEVTRYVGGESPSLDRMGGADWKARKSKARKAVREIAAGLIKLYAARRATKGFAFSADTPWQREMEDAFNYTETPDQLSCIEDVKRDMEQIVPMDRLVCGDVGFGKDGDRCGPPSRRFRTASRLSWCPPHCSSSSTSRLSRSGAGFPVAAGAVRSSPTRKPTLSRGWLPGGWTW